MPQRIEALKLWLGEQLSSTDFGLAPASSDASFRRYFRITLDGQSWIAMDAPPEQEQTEPYVHIAGLLRSVGLNAPQIIAQDSVQGFLLLSDLGSTDYLSTLDQHNVDTLYTDALDALYCMQTGLIEPASQLPDYDAAFLKQEMALFSKWYLGKHCGMHLDDRQQQDLETVFDYLARLASEQPRVFVHRDYHSRNLMVTSKNNPGILDFQDAMYGPVTYDLVSLLRDCYIQWPETQVKDWALQYLRQVQTAGLIPVEVGEDTLLQWFDWMGIQRHLKATGIFARLKWRDNKPGYVQDIPRTLGYVRTVSRRYTELEPLENLLYNLPITA